MPQAAAAGLDVGGTKMLAALVASDGLVLHAEQVATPDQDEPLVDAMVALLRRVRQEAGTELPVGVGFPAMVTLDGLVRYGPNISLREYPLRQVLSERLQTPVLVDNDANAATWAEFRIGAGRDVRDMLMFTLGTGVGGGLVIGGRLVRGANGFAGEMGHLIIQAGGRPGPSGVHGELEAYSSGSAIGQFAVEAHASGALVGTELHGPAPPSASEIADAAVRGVGVAAEIMARVGRHLGIAAAGLANCLDPAMVVVGGGAAAAGEMILKPARSALRQHLLGPDHRPPLPLMPAELGPQAGVIGAALLALEDGG